MGLISRVSSRTYRCSSLIMERCLYLTFNHFHPCVTDHQAHQFLNNYNKILRILNRSADYCCFVEFADEEALAEARTSLKKKSGPNGGIIRAYKAKNGQTAVEQMLLTIPNITTKKYVELPYHGESVEY